eukprot:11888483-Prorocentrum_lima.AAC.1
MLPEAGMSPAASRTSVVRCRCSHGECGVMRNGLEWARSRGRHACWGGAVSDGVWVLGKIDPAVD